ncbi:O-acyltransferase WSD1-like [Cucumis melo var. makuwa]|uniref:O-acyltransferase WSD1-like n=2 Tax=Cucumis melo TaxID=3656 RepID=A0A5A7SKE3_CUCMM|nr:O-acyltransferase WSD1-like [Cucumis melo var. makuwa]TYK06985.1 O-acyltransferase WSD1-like [Cucumis melo var. makuwa]
MDSSLLQQPLSPIAEYLSSPMLSLSVLAILEFQVPIHTLDLAPNLRNLFLPINPRFSSILVTNEQGEKKWKRVNVEVEEHVKDPIFPPGLTIESYKAHFDEYLTKISMEEFRPDKPLWETHLFKYPTSPTVAGTMILKLHHSLGDGYSLMGVVLSCLHTASDPNVPLTFPSRRQRRFNNGVVKSLTGIVSAVCRTASDLGWSVFKGIDEKTPIRSGREGLQFMPMNTFTVSFSLNDIKKIKTKLQVTVNDVITGIIFMGLRLYMEEIEKNSGEVAATALTIVNTRVIGNYRSATEMAKPESKGLWGNQLSYLEIMIPKMTNVTNPLEFVMAAHRSINNKRTSFTIHVVAHLLNLLRKLRGHQEVAKFLHNLLKNTTTVISNVIGPLQQMALDNHPISGLYFTIVGTPQSVTVTMLSYMGKLRVAFRTEKDFIDAHKLNCCMEDAFEKIFEAANDIP